MEYTGTVTKILQTVQVSEKFRRREFVVTDGAQTYPQLISFQLTQDRCDLIDPINVGDEVNVKFNLRGRSWTNPTTNEVKYFNTLDAWAIVKLEGEKFKGETLTPEPLDDMPF